MEKLQLLLEMLEANGNLQGRAEDIGLLYAIDEDGNAIVVDERTAYRTDEGLILSEYLADGSLRESSGLEKQTIELLYLLPGDIKSGEENRIAAVENEALPLPPGYSVGQIVCQEHVFTISSKAGNPPICGAFEVIRREFHSVPYSYHTRGLTASALELYYYEVLAESHQLYMEEKTFKQEMKERKNRTKNSKKKQIAKTDFHKDTGNQYTCEKKINLWGISTWIYAIFEENSNDPKRTLKQYISQLDSHILWVEKHRREIEHSLLDSDMVKWANHWVEGHDSFEENGQMYYELEDCAVPYPITEEAFLENLYIQSITIQSIANQSVTADSSTPNAVRISFFLDTVPSYFGDHSIQLLIDAREDISESARAKWKYTIHKAGIAG